MNKKSMTGMMGFGVLLMLLGSVLPFVDASDLVKDGKVSLFGGAVIVWMIFGVIATVFTFMGKGILALVFAILASGGMFLSFFANQLGAAFGTGLGYYLTICSALYMLVAGIVVFITFKKSSAPQA